jgi:ABC-type uncharacterized transport system substrate-binding protein
MRLALRNFSIRIGAVLIPTLCSFQASAHPHVWITVETTVLYENGAFAGLRHRWTFDEFYSAMEVEGLDKNNDGKLDREELAELANFYVSGLKEYSYFTFPTVAGQKVTLGEPKDIWLEHKDNVLSLNFTLPFANPVSPTARGFAFSVYDPSYYIALTIDKPDSVRLADGAPKSCKIAIGSRAKELGNDKALNEAFAAQFGRMAMGSVKPVSITCSSSK